MGFKHDIDQLKRDNDIIDVVEKHLHLKKRGAEWYGICPFHDDHETSLQVTQSKQIFKCFACGAGGDMFDFLMKLGHTLPQALAEVAGDSFTNSGNIQRDTIKRKPRPEQVQWKQITPAPEQAPPDHYRNGKPSRFWSYRSADGGLIGHVCRFDIEDGSKEVIPTTYRTDGNRSEWRWQGFDKPRPLYNLPLIAANPDATILIVEGEKTADAAQAQLDPAKTVVTTWPGGSMAIAHIEWAPLHSRKVIMWPDNDAQGLSAMLHIRHLIGEHLQLCKIVPLDTTLPKGCDAADKEWTEGELRAFLLERIVGDIPANAGENRWRINQVDRSSEYEFGVTDGEWKFVKLAAAPVAAAPVVEPEPVVASEAVVEQEPLEEPEQREPWEPDTSDGMPEDMRPPSDEPGSFRFLGFINEGGNLKHHFYSFQSKTVIILGASSISLANLMSLAPLNYWEMYFPGKSGVSMNAAVNWLVNASMEVGMFDEDKIRGRGAWYEKGNTIIHAGEHLIVNGVKTRLNEYHGKYVYERAKELELSVDNPIGTSEANALMDIVKLLNWEREISAYLLAGWCVIAPLCGALKWRPHIWLTGAAGTGKSWVFQKIVRRLMEGMALAVQGDTSEAGIRQTLRHDALPIVFDEAEGEDKRAQERMQSILGLMRSSSSEDGGVIAKGSAGGSSVSYKIRSCFAFASISVQVAQQSDRTRVTVLGLKKAEQETGPQRWSELQRRYAEVMTDEFVSGLQARTIMLLPTILENARVFATAAAEVIGEQRAGDQLGSMLAGAYSLHSNKRISYDEAVKWLKDKDWSEEKALDKTRDEVSLLAHLMEQIISVETMNGRYDRNVGELVQTAANDPDTPVDFILPLEANARLKRNGMKVENDHLVISNTADSIKKVLANTPWAKNHNKILLRLDGATSMDTTRFGSGIQTRAVAIPLKVIFGGAVPDQQPKHDLPW